MRIKKAGIITKLVILILMVYATVSLFSLQARIDEAEVEKTALIKDVQEKTAGNTALEYEIEHSTDPKTVEDIARNKLGLLLPGERVIYDVSN